MRVIAWLVLSAVLSGCSMGYYLQAINGELAILNQRRPLYAVIKNPATPDAIRTKLKKVHKARKYAIDKLGLPKSGSYSTYVALDRDWPVWVVSAAPEFSLAPLHWCFLFAGCVPYRGYFDKQDATDFARQLKAKGNDVLLRGAAAYSTLGWFEDPILSSMLRWGKVTLVAMIFHEMAHQKLYVEDDAAFNESFASAVSQIGVSRYFSVRDPQALERWREERGASRALQPFLNEARGSLAVIYASEKSADQKRNEKRAEFHWLAERYRQVGKRYGIEYSKRWLESLNNASLAQLQTYSNWVQAFKRLYHCNDDKLTAFYQAAARIGQLMPEQRHRRLDALEGAAHSGKACELSSVPLSAAPQSSGGR